MARSLIWSGISVNHNQNMKAIISNPLTNPCQQKWQNFGYQETGDRKSFVGRLFRCPKFPKRMYVATPSNARLPRRYGFAFLSGLVTFRPGNPLASGWAGTHSARCGITSLWDTMSWQSGRAHGLNDPQPTEVSWGGAFGPWLACAE